MIGDICVDTRHAKRSKVQNNGHQAITGVEGMLAIAGKSICNKNNVLTYARKYTPQVHKNIQAVKESVPRYKSVSSKNMG